MMLWIHNITQCCAAVPLICFILFLVEALFFDCKIKKNRKHKIELDKGEVILCECIARQFKIWWSKDDLPFPVGVEGKLKIR